MKILFMIAATFSSALLGYTNKNQNANEGIKKLGSSFLLQSFENPCNEGDDEDPQPMLNGVVKDNTAAHNPIYHACVEIKTSGGTSVSIIGTNAVGHYYFNSIAIGTYNLVVSAPGYTTQTIPFTVTGSPQTLDVTL